MWSCYKFLHFPVSQHQKPLNYDFPFVIAASFVWRPCWGLRQGRPGSPVLFALECVAHAATGRFTTSQINSEISEALSQTCFRPGEEVLDRSFQVSKEILAVSVGSCRSRKHVCGSCLDADGYFSGETLRFVPGPCWEDFVGLSLRHCFFHCISLRPLTPYLHAGTLDLKDRKWARHVESATARTTSFWKHNRLPDLSTSCVADRRKWRVEKQTFIGRIIVLKLQ